MARELIDSKITTATPSMPIWNRIFPPKVSCFIWRCGLGRIPVAKCLKDRGVSIGSELCPMCNMEIENVDHALVNYSIAKETRDWIFKWCHIPPVQLATTVDLLNYAATWGNCPRKRKTFVAIIHCMLWQLWNARNDKVFNGRLKTSTIIADESIVTSFDWAKYRGNRSCTWADWVCHPLSFL